jgi:hypothetical protein
VRNLAEDNAGLALQQEEATGSIHSRTTYPHIALDRGGRFTEGNRCSIRLSYGATRRENTVERPLRQLELCGPLSGRPRCADRLHRRLASALQVARESRHPALLPSSRSIAVPRLRDVDREWRPDV